MAVNKNPKWIEEGKTIQQLIKELQSFENQNLEVVISLDNGKTHKPISLVSKKENKYCLLEYCGKEK